LSFEIRRFGFKKVTSKSIPEDFANKKKEDNTFSNQKMFSFFNIKVISKACL